MYRCELCNVTFEKKTNKCPNCREKRIIEINNYDYEVNSISISDNNLAIERDSSKCIGCGMCKNTCKLRENLRDNKCFNNCVGCGQCIQTCPTGALIPKNDIGELEKNLKNKVCIALVAPAVRVTIGDAFNKKYGSFEEKKIVGLLKQIGFKYVFDVTFGADLTIMEESYELVERIKNKEKLPMLSSCCPSWVLYAEKYYPEILDNLSTCKSPISMLSTIIRTYFLNKKHLKEEDVYIVSIVPCTAKKYEVKRKELNSSDLAITTYELINYINNKKIDYEKVKEVNFDNVFNGSTSGLIFGASGGVTEAVIRNTYHILTNDTINNFELKEVRGLDGVKEANILIGDEEINIAVVNGLSNAKRLLDQLKKKKSKYEFIEIMNCFGGCIGGGGNPKLDIFKEAEIKEKRIDSLYEKDRVKKIRVPYQNKALMDIYSKYLGKPNGKKAIKLLHTTYNDKTDTIRK